MQRFASIQALRGIAVLGVIAFHALLVYGAATLERSTIAWSNSRRWRWRIAGGFSGSGRQGAVPEAGRRKSRPRLQISPVEIDNDEKH
jgi:peptidoglycan/LPS O-acetylase OafA/YrhL